MTEPGLDIHEEILVRLEVNDLIRCKSVCKSWNSLISSDRFIKSQLNYTVKKKAGDTTITTLTTTRFCVDDCKIMRSHECMVVGSSNGLVCICHYGTHFLVVNPSTHEVKKLSNPRGSYVSGFGFDSSIYVSGFGYDSSIDVFEVLTLKSNIWRSVSVESDYDYLYGNGILCNGAIHWYTFQNNKKVIVSFDLSKEVFKEIPQPILSYWDIGTMKDCLCIYAENEIWVMRSYNVQESWELELPPPGYDTNKPVMHYIPQGDIFPGHVHIWLLEEGSCVPILVRSIERPPHEFDYPRNAHIRLSTSECYNYNHHVFVKSLVSPHGMGDGDGGGDGDGNINDVISLSTLFL